MKAAVLMLLLMSGCIQTVYTQAPICPLWSDAAIMDLWRLQTIGMYPDLEVAIGNQELFCHALEPEPDVCQGWGCWWWRLWN